MEVRSLSWRTDLALLEQSGSEIESHSDHVVARTPDNPTFHWGNFLLLDRAPTAQEVPRWVELFVTAFPQATHRAIGVDDPTGTTDDLAPLADAGFAIEASTVLTARRVTLPTRVATGVEIRMLRNDDDWAQRVALTVARYPDHGPDTAEFLVRRAASERRRVESGFGAWFGAFEHGRLVSALGIFRAGDGLARYQDVETHPDAERRGLAGTLIHTSALYAMSALRAHTLVIVADPDYRAIELYRRLGFTDTETQLQAYIASVD